MIRAIIAGLIFWALTLLFPTITITGFWTIAGVVIIGGLINIIYQLTFGLLLIPFRILTLGFLTLLVNTGVVYLLAHWFNNFTILPNTFWWTVLFTFCYTLATRLVYGGANSND